MIRPNTKRSNFVVLFGALTYLALIIQNRDTNLNILESFSLETETLTNIAPSIHCARWIQKLENRKVLFVNFRYNGNGIDDYVVMAKSLESVLSEQYFDIVKIDRQSFIDMSLNEVASFRRIFYMILPNEDFDWVHHFDHFESFCKLRVLVSDLNLIDNDARDKKNLSKLDSKQILLGIPHPSGIFIGWYMPIEVVGIKRTRLLKNRDNVALIYGTKFGDIVDHSFVILELVEHGFTVFILLDDLNNHDKYTITIGGDEHRIHQNLTEENIFEIASKSAFMLGIGKIPLFPLMIGLASGAAVLNPITWNNSYLAQFNQPYVYNVDLGNTNNYTQAAEWAVNYRFQSFIPPELRLGSVNDRTCALMDDDALCRCPNPTFPINGDERNHLYDKFGGDSNVIDCRSSFLIKKQPIFPVDT